ncbi:MAG: hypothetical protein ABL958_01705 [Bdellovibrionia bacterium]
MVRIGLSFVVAGLLTAVAAKADVPADLELNLGTSVSYNIQVSSTTADTVKLTIDRADLDKVKGGEKVLVTLTPSEVVLKPNTPVNIEFKVTVPTDSPSFEAVKIGVNSKSNGGRVNVGETMVAVKAIYEVALKGNSPEEWSLPKTASFSTHKNGLLVRFLNYDKTKKHQIHSGGAIPHSDNPLEAANEQGPVGSYEYTVKSAATPSKAGVYCHDHEGFGQTRTLNFNVQ